MKSSALMIVAMMFFSFAGQGQGNNQEESFPGQKGLSVLLEATGSFEGKIFLQDSPIPGPHAEQMFDTLAQSVPKEHILTFEGVEGSIHKIEEMERGWASVDHAEEMKKHGVRVVHVPTLWHHNAHHSRREAALQVLKSQDILAVYAAGNFTTIPPDIYRQDSPYWGNPPPWDENARKLPEYQVVEEFFQEGHAIMANFAIRKPETFEDFVSWALKSMDKEDLQEMYYAAEGEYIRHPLTVRFGALREYGFSVSLKEKRVQWNRDERWYIPGTSDASAHVAVFAFYLYQLWDTTKEVVEVMQQTATDIGEPGVDEEFGWGLINADHPLIWNRAVQRLEESLEVYLFADVTLEQAITVAEDNLDVFYHIGEDKREIGLTFGTHKTTVAFAAGSTASPFGVSSRFLQQRNTAAQIGVRYSFTDTFSITGIYGRSKHEDFDVNKGSIGVDYQKHFLGDTGEFSLYAGHRSIWGSLGLPGYNVLDIAQTPFTLRMVEARASFALRF